MKHQRNSIRNSIRRIHTQWPRLFVCILLLLVSAGIATVGLAAPNHSGASDDDGLNSYGLSGGYRVGLLTEQQRTVAIAGSGGYGILESTGPVAGKHHGMYGMLAMSYQFSSLLAASLYFSGLLQYHPRDEQGRDRTLLGMPGLLIRSGFRIHPALMLGGEINVVVPGSGAPSIVWRGTTVDVTPLLTVRIHEHIRLGMKAGFRLDNSHSAIPEGFLLRYGDRLAMPWSEFHAVPVGASLVARIGPVMGVAEISGELLIGKIPFSVSPMRGVVGVRYVLRSRLQLSAMNVFSLSARPDDHMLSRIFPVEPRYTVWLGVAVLLHKPVSAVARKESDRQEAIPVATKAAPPPEVKPEVAQPPADAPGEAGKTAGPVTGTVKATVLDTLGEPVAGVEVNIQSGEYRRTVITDREGVFVVEDVPVGEARISVVVAYFEPMHWKAMVNGDGEVVQESIPPLVESDVGSQIRGLVRNIKGEAVNATVSVEPGEMMVDTQESGEFQMNVTPGQYTVKISARGYRTQTRKIRVGENSVEVLNVDLRPEK